ncbi:TetR/AcrR family transcriptional regulator [Rudaeicoccus suwonensis]|uniref:TetR family transcriptional regulator n=1 Tax=Rudaeicoccus suwonensis TaxID=657409 RepID=A0A561E7Q6_9MICO|nr:TetR/AcrR family transcriptional regulator [Rudaeicoccus suwonensis]TWE11590.1 TetR family transcriptional regulator [Rudaeicoccus suwonensis]
MTSEAAPAGDSTSRDRLLDAARDAFAAKGFHGTTTRDIAAAAGMSPAALYVHHPTKESLLFEISRAGHEATVARLSAARAATVSPTEQLRLMVREFVIGHTARHTTARVVNYELEALTPEHRVVIDELRHAIQQLMREVLAAGVESGEFACADIGMTANAIMGMSIDVARWYHEDGDWSGERIAAHHADTAVLMAGASSSG